MGKVLRTMAIAGSLALAAGTGASGVLAQDDDVVVVGSTETVSAEALAEAILAEVLAGLSDSGGLVIDVPTIGESGGDVVEEPAGDINVGGGMGGTIMVGGGTGGDVSLGGGAMTAPPAEAPAEAPAPMAPAPEASMAPAPAPSMAPTPGY